MESDRYSSLVRQGASDQNKITPDGSPSTSVLKPRPKTLSPTKRPRNLRVVLENVDYRESTYTSDLFSIELALARLSGSKCVALQRTPPATDSTGKTDDKLTVLRSLIDQHLLHCQHCREQMEDLEYFKPEQSEQSESPGDVSRVIIDDFNLPAQEMSRLWAQQDKYIDLLESKLEKMSRVSQREQMFMFKLIKKKQELKEMTTQLEKLKASRVSELGLSGEGWVCNKCYCHGIRKKDICQFPSCKASNKSPENIKRVCTSCFINVTKRSQDLTINKPLDASCGDKQPNRSLLKRKTYTILKGGGGGMVTIPIKKLRESEKSLNTDTDPLEIIENKIPGVGDSEDYIGEEEDKIDNSSEDMEINEDLFPCVLGKEISVNIEPEQEKVQPDFPLKQNFSAMTEGDTPVKIGQQPQFTIDERAYMFCQYQKYKDVDTKYLKHVIDDFKIKFPNSRIPNRETVWRIVKKFLETGTVNNLPRIRGKNKNVIKSQPKISKSKIPVGDNEKNIEDIEPVEKDDRYEKEVKTVDNNVEDMEFKEELVSSDQDKEISGNIEPEQEKVKPESSSSSTLKLKSFSELTGGCKPSELSATGSHCWTMTEGDTADTAGTAGTPESWSVPPLTSSEVAADTFVPALGGAVTPIAPGTKVMSSKVLRMTDTETGLPSGVYSLVKPDRSKAVVIVKKTEVREAEVDGKKSLYQSPVNIYIEEMRKQMTLIFNKNKKGAPTEDQIVRMAMNRWSQMSEEQKQIYRRLSQPIEEPQGISVPRNKIVKMARQRWSLMSEEQKQIYRRLSKPIEEPQGISLPKTVKSLLVEDPSLPQGWSRSLQQKYNQITRTYDVGVCVLTADKVRLFNTEGVKKYLAKHPYTDIDPDSISFNPYKQNDSHQHQDPAGPEASNRITGGEVKEEQAETEEDPLALEDSGENLDLFSSVSSLEQIYGNIDT